MSKEMSEKQKALKLTVDRLEKTYGKGAIMRSLLNGIGFGTTELTVARPHSDRMTSEYLHRIFIMLKAPIPYV